jgi:predicted HTH domain antitoxin
MGYNLFDCRPKVRNLTNEEPLPSKQTDEDRLSMLLFQNKEQKTEELNEAHQCRLYMIREKTISNLRDDLTVIQKELEDFDKVIVERDLLLVILEYYAHVDDELEKLRKTVNEGSMMKNEIEKLNIKVAELEEQRCSEAKKSEEAIKQLNEVVEELKQEIHLLRDYDAVDDTIVARSDEAVEHLSEAGYKKIKNKQVRYSFPPCQVSGEFKQKFKGSWLSSGLLRRVVL